MIIAVAGLPGVGKTTLADQLVRHLPGALLLNKDRVRHALFGPEHTTYTRDQDDHCVQLLFATAAWQWLRTPEATVVLDGRTWLRPGQLPGAGKSTQTQMLHQCLRAAGHPVTTVPDLATLPTEPVSTSLIQLLRASRDPFLRTGDAITDTLITAAIRADLVATVLDPTLNAPGAIVIEDRGIHTMASYAIASLLREHDAPASITLDWLDALTALTGPHPAHAFWLRMPPELATRRADQRNASTRPPFNGEQRAYLAWVDHAYQLLATRDPQLHVLDVTDLDPLQTHRAVHQALDRIDRTGDTAIPTCASTTEPSGTPPKLATTRPRPPCRAEPGSRTE